MSPDHWAHLVRWPQWYATKGFMNLRSMGAGQRNIRLGLLALALVLIYVLHLLVSGRETFPTSGKNGKLIWADSPRGRPADEWTPEEDDFSRDTDLGRVRNRTLGFEKVFTIGLKERTDKRDAMALMSSLTGFDIEWFEGVRPGDIPDKAVPFGIDVSSVRDNFLGSWRGHLNVIRQ